MKKSLNISVFLIVIFLISSCGSVKVQNSKETKIFNSSEQELEYYYAFTEATKLFIFGNYNDAISLYNQCLRYNPESSAVNFQLSNIYLRIGQIDIAKKYAIRSNELEKNNIWYLLHLASIYQVEKKIDSTIVIYEKIVKLDNMNIGHLTNLALLYKENSNYKKALKTINKIIDYAGINERILFMKHDIFELIGKQKRAIEELKFGISLFPDNIDLHGLLAEYYYDIGKTNEAEHMYQKVLSLDSSSYKVLLSYADYLINSGRGSEAFIYYHKSVYNAEIDIRDKLLLLINFLNNDKIFYDYTNEIISLNNELKKIYKDDIRVWALAVDLNIKGNNLKEASEDLKYIINRNGKNYNEWEKLLYIENSIGESDSIIFYADNAIELFNDKPNLYLFRSIGYMKMNDYRSALNSLNEGIKYCKASNEYLQFYNYLAESYHSLEIYDSSDFYFDKALLIDENNLIIRNNYSYYLSLRSKNLELAKKLSNLTVKSEPKNATFLDTYAWILYKMNKRKEALKYIRLAVKYDEGNVEILDHFGEILYSNSKYSEALDIWQKVLDIQPQNDEIKIKIEKISKFLE